MQKSSADSSLLAEAPQGQPLDHENKSSQCSETLRLIRPTAVTEHVFRNTSLALQLRPSWLEDSHIRERCDGTNSSTEDAVARCAATHKETEYTGDTYRSIPSNTSQSGILSPFPITSPEFQGGMCGPSRVLCAKTRFSALARNPCVFKLSITLVVLKVDEEPPRSSIAILSGTLPWPKVG